MPTIPITIDFSDSGTDPGTVPNPATDGPGYIKPVLVKSPGNSGPDWLIKVTEPDTVLSFSFANAPEGANPRFTGFQYYNTGDEWWDKGWWTPDTPDATEFPTLTIVDPDPEHDPPIPASMTVVDRTHNHTLYVYVVEWEETGPNGETRQYCCDPKIKNEPGGLIRIRSTWRAFWRALTAFWRGRGSGS